MDGAQKLIQAIATILWPLIVILVIFIFRPAVRTIMESAKSRKFTLKIGGQELTMEEANSAQQKLISDLQAQVTAIQRVIGGPQAIGALTATEPSAESASRGRSILWVDDNPKNNAYFVQHLYDLGVAVDIVKSSADGFAKFNSKAYDYVISDMGRREGLTYNPRAGIDFLKLVREKDNQIPFIIFCSARAAREYGPEAIRLGATSATSSPTELFGLLNIQGAKSHA